MTQNLDLSLTATGAAAMTRPGVIHVVLALGGFAIGTTEFATMSLLPYLAHDLRISVPVAGHVISAYALGVVVGAPLIAVLAARLRRRTLLIALMGVYALANGLSAVAPNYRWMLALRFLSGLPHGAYFGIAMLVAASVYPQISAPGCRPCTARFDRRDHCGYPRQLAGSSRRLAMVLRYRRGVGARHCVICAMPFRNAPGHENEPFALN